MAFHEVQLPSDIAFGARGGPLFSTDIVTTFGGNEQRNANWSAGLGLWNVAHGIKTASQLSALIAFFRARQGRAHGFRFKDWTDYSVTGGNIGTGDNSETGFQLRKQYTSGAVTYNRDCKKIVSGSYTIYVDAIEQTEGGSNDYTMDVDTGLITFNSAPASMAVITADFEFDVPVRFDTDHFNASIEAYQTYSWPEIPIVEIRV